MTPQQPPYLGNGANSGRSTTLLEDGMWRSIDVKQYASSQSWEGAFFVWRFATCGCETEDWFNFLQMNGL